MRSALHGVSGQACAVLCTAHNDGQRRLQIRENHGVIHNRVTYNSTNVGPYRYGLLLMMYIYIPVQHHVCALRLYCYAVGAYRTCRSCSTTRYVHVHVVHHLIALLLGASYSYYQNNTKHSSRSLRVRIRVNFTVSSSTPYAYPYR